MKKIIFVISVLLAILSVSLLEAGTIGCMAALILGMPSIACAVVAYRKEHRHD